jgi:hypothetical protein
VSPDNQNQPRTKPNASAAISCRVRNSPRGHVFFGRYNATQNGNATHARATTATTAATTTAATTAQDGSAQEGPA